MTEMSSKWPIFPPRKDNASILDAESKFSLEGLGISLGTGTLIFAPIFDIKVILMVSQSAS